MEKYKYKSIVDTYILNGFESVFLRPLTPLGYAAEYWENIGYSVEEFVEFYSHALEYILELNISGKSSIKEGHAGIFLQKIITVPSSSPRLQRICWQKIFRSTATAADMVYQRQIPPKNVLKR